jgi:hypothetical protein
MGLAQQLKMPPPGKRTSTIWPQEPHLKTLPILDIYHLAISVRVRTSFRKKIYRLKEPRKISPWGGFFGRAKEPIKESTSRQKNPTHLSFSPAKEF